MEKKSKKEQVKELTERLEQGVREVFTSGAYENYLKVMSKFHRYSFRNTVLIWQQNPAATYVAGFDAWKNDFKRYVKKGEKAIRIFAPTEYTVPQQKQVIDPVTKLPMVDAQGKPVMETVDVKRRGFMATSVFDISQTDGQELPELVKKLDGKVENYDAMLEAIKSVSPVQVEFGYTGEADGYYSARDEKIVISDFLGPTQTILAVLHEVTHAKLHNPEMSPKEKKTKEVEAESVAYVVCQKYGIMTGDNSFGYIASWSQDKELPELKASLQVISKTANSMIKDIDKKLEELLGNKEKASVMDTLEENKDR